ncbi:hypothetical protein L596_002511 [Steinernema carpocapsae]|uniref:C2H2-type domain-containing protein n=1 Tax=Steinernema carpocapsae TaxID=34508 RepID=A0A4U8UPZ8_STECR|nr:hypothetical protein L596_002511 [Steinernema carpocapsae]
MNVDSRLVLVQSSTLRGVCEVSLELQSEKTESRVRPHVCPPSFPLEIPQVRPGSLWSRADLPDLGRRGVRHASAGRRSQHVLTETNTSRKSHPRNGRWASTSGPESPTEKIRRRSAEMRPSSTESTEDVVTDNLQRFTKPRLLRRAPRIISRARKTVLKKRSVREASVIHEIDDMKPLIVIERNARKNGRKKPLDPLLEEDLKGVIVQGGLMRVAQSESALMEVYPGTSSDLEFPKYSENTVESLGERVKLPGIADDIEAYPCGHCQDRVFLTGCGLENHTRITHPEHLEEVLEEISKISTEWQRRDAVVKRSPQPTITRRNFSSNLTFEACRICGRLVNVEHPTAFDNHLRAHKKNDQLRDQMVRIYGEEHVLRLTCLDCHLVFPDERKLSAHKQHMHIRKRNCRYICKWCGTMCMSMTELNIHKAEEHNMPILKPRYELSPPLKIRSHFGATALGQRANAHRKSQSGDSGCYERVMQSSDEVPCRTSCHLCGMIMVKPALLVRHMLRVHSKNSFTATIETKGLPPFRAELERGRVTWWCCEMAFGDRNALMYHRRISHTCKLDEDESHHVPETTTTIHIQPCSIPLTPPDMLLEDNVSHGVPSLSSVHSSEGHSPEQYNSDLDTNHLMDHLEDDEDLDEVPSSPVQSFPSVKQIKLEPLDSVSVVEVTKRESSMDSQDLDEPMYVLVPTDVDISAAKEETRTLILDTGDKGQQQVTLSLEQFEQLRLHAGVNFDNLQVYFMPQEQMLLI